MTRLVAAIFTLLFTLTIMAIIISMMSINNSGQPVKIALPTLFPVEVWDY